MLLIHTYLLPSPDVCSLHTSQNPRASILEGTLETSQSKPSFYKQGHWSLQKGRHLLEITQLMNARVETRTAEQEIHLPGVSSCFQLVLILSALVGFPTTQNHTLSRCASSPGGSLVVHEPLSAGPGSFLQRNECHVTWKCALCRDACDIHAYQSLHVFQGHQVEKEAEPVSHL